MIISVTILYFLAAGLKASLPLLLPFIAKDIHITLADVGVLSALVNALGIVVSLPASYIAQKFGSLKVLIFTFLIYAASFIGISLAMDFPLLFVCFFLAGLGFGVFLPISLAVMAKLFSKETRGKQIGNYSATGDIGRILLGGSISFLVAFIGWKFTAAAYGGIALIVFLVMYKLFVHKNVAIEQSKEELPDTTQLKHLLKNVPFIYSNMAGSLDLIASGSLFIFLPFLLISKGFSPSIIGSFAAAYFLGSFFGKMIIGRLVDKFGNRRLFIISEILMAVCIVLLILSHELIFIIVLSIVVGALTKGTVPASLSILTEILDKHGSYEKGFGLNTLAINVASTVGPLLLGFLADSYGINAAFYASAGIALLATVPVALLAAYKRK